MPLKNSDNILNVPVWIGRRWFLFKKFISHPSVVEAVTRYQREGYIDTNTYPMWALGDIVNNYRPDGCDKAFDALLNKPGITDQELVDLIEPPIKIVSHVHKSIGLSNNPIEDYERYMHKIGADELPDDVDELYEEDTGLYLRIAPFTNRTEIKAFITKYYEKEMWPHLQERPVWDTKKSEYIDNPNSKTRSSIGESELKKQRILSLKAEGKNAAEIENVITREFTTSPTQSNIRKIISDSKQK